MWGCEEDTCGLDARGGLTAFAIGNSRGGPWPAPRRSFAQGARWPGAQRRTRPAPVPNEQEQVWENSSARGAPRTCELPARKPLTPNWPSLFLGTLTPVFTSVPRAQKAAARGERIGPPAKVPGPRGHEDPGG